MKTKGIFPCMFLLLWLFTTTIACTRYQYQLEQVPVLPTRGADIYPQQQNKNGLIIAVDDYSDPDKSSQVFGMNFTDSNILVLEVIISNRSKDIYTIRREEMLLINGTQVIYPVSPTKLELSKKIGGYFQFLELQDLTVKPGENKSGFLYFLLPREREQSYFSFLWPSDYRLRLGATKTDEGEDTRLIYTLVLPNVNFSD